MTEDYQLQAWGPHALPKSTLTCWKGGSHQFVTIRYSNRMEETSKTECCHRQFRSSPKTNNGYGLEKWTTEKKYGNFLVSIRSFDFWGEKTALSPHDK